MFPGAAAAVAEEPQLKGGSCILEGSLEAHFEGPSASDSLTRPDEGMLEETAGKQQAWTAADTPRGRFHACTGRPARPADADVAAAVKYGVLAACRWTSAQGGAHRGSPWHVQSGQGSWRETASLTLVLCRKM